jgi:hypothetical protein
MSIFYSNPGQTGEFYTFKIPAELISLHPTDSKMSSHYNNEFDGLYLNGQENLTEFLIEKTVDENIAKEYKAKQILELEKQKQVIEKEIKNLKK